MDQMTFSLFFQSLINGLNQGAIYALIALGYTMVYGIIGMINFAHGDFIMIGAYTLFYTIPLMVNAGMPAWLSVIVAIAVCALVGVLVETFAYRPVRKAGPMSALITALAMSIFLENLAMVLFGAKPHNVQAIFSLPTITVGSVALPLNVLLTIAIGLGIMIALQLFVKKTKLGKAMRAVPQDKDASTLVGINVNKIITTTFAIGSGLAAVAALYLLFLGVQSAGLFGGAEYLAQKGLSYAEWARSGFFQMVGVTVVNLTLLLAAVQWSRREGGAWRAVRLLSALLTAESLLLLLSAAWRMTLYVDVYGLSFKRCMTYWGMGMMAAFLLAAAWKVRRPDFRFCRVVFPLALAGWLVINCVPVDYLVAKDQVDRYLSGESGVLDAEYLLYDLSYDTLSQLERLDGDMVCTAYGDWDAIGTARLSILLEQRRQEARTDCADWRTWSLSAWLASRGGA